MVDQETVRLHVATQMDAASTINIAKSTNSENY
jgi:hypothetical protein